MATISRTARFAVRTGRMRASTIREMLKVTQQPDVISFGGGLPAPELFPTEEIAECTAEVMRDVGPQALQYGVTDGIPEMRTWVAERLSRHTGATYEPDNVLIVNGSQQGLDLLAKIFIDPGDHIVLENPSYLGAIQAFDAYQARYLTADTDEDGMIPESLERVLAHAEPLPKFVYLIPNFQNPTGRTLAADRRERVVRICEHFGVPIVEDDPYGELRFHGKHLPSLASFARSGLVIYSGTGSKIMAPGMRIAWLATHDHEVREKLVLAKQGADLQSGTLTQYVFYRYVSKAEAFERHLAAIVQVYGERRDVMHEALSTYMPPNVQFNNPEGGMFLWARVRGVDTTELLKVSAEQKVVFVPGVSFYPTRDVTDGMRLNFSNSGAEKIRTGVQRLAHSLRSMSQ
ncbi:MAG TPA: PLP-dependent aminotransferase family protein [Candidatus Baltobacteraceae bacterium]|jgi:2-aminoadipate transaminase|nr:PLP-dependent aminotransferase family protein [Candidatus Baltobacteraceae bacterium]